MVGYMVMHVHILIKCVLYFRGREFDRGRGGRDPQRRFDMRGRGRGGWDRDRLVLSYSRRCALTCS